VVVLVRNGFKYEDILDKFTYKQVRGFYESCCSLESDTIKNNAYAARIGFHADKDTFERIWK